MTQASGVLASQVIYVRFAPQAKGNINGKITHTSGVLAEDLLVNGMGTEEVTGVEDKLQSGGISIYPIPTSGVLYLESKTSALAGAQIKITDLTGKVVFQSLCTTESDKLETGLQRGVYFIRIRVKGKQYIERIIME